MSADRNVRPRLLDDPGDAYAGGSEGFAAGPTQNVASAHNPTCTYLYHEVYDSTTGLCAGVQLGNMLQGLLTSCVRLMAMREDGGHTMNINHTIEVPTLFSTMVFGRCIGGAQNSFLYFTDTDLNYTQDGELVDDLVTYQENNPNAVIRTIPANEAVFRSFLLNAQDADELACFKAAMPEFKYGILRVFVGKGEEREPHFVAVLFRNQRYYLTTGVRDSKWFSCSNLRSLLYTDGGKTALLVTLMRYHSNGVELDFGTNEPAFFCPKVYLRDPLVWTQELRDSAEEVIEWTPMGPRGTWPSNARRAVHFVALNDVDDIDALCEVPENEGMV